MVRTVTELHGQKSIECYFLCTKTSLNIFLAESAPDLTKAIKLICGVAINENDISSVTNSRNVVDLLSWFLQFRVNLP